LPSAVMIPPVIVNDNVLYRSLSGLASGHLGRLS
jgi:hypothetical protein